MTLALREVLQMGFINTKSQKFDTILSSKQEEF